MNRINHKLPIRMVVNEINGMSVAETETQLTLRATENMCQVLTCVGMIMGPVPRTDPGYTSSGCWSPGS
jgi:hypothetical protein